MGDYPFTSWFRPALRRYLREHRVSRDELARKLGLTGASVHRWDRGLSFPNVAQRVKLAAFFGMPEDDVARLVRESEKRRRREAERRDADRSDAAARSRGRKKPRPTGKTWLGRMAGTAQIVGDIVSPTTRRRDWHALR
jgi:transcriptional regulator with XRE-family HTH domain